MPSLLSGRHERIERVSARWGGLGLGCAAIQLPALPDRGFSGEPCPAAMPDLDLGPRLGLLSPAEHEVVVVGVAVPGVAVELAEAMQRGGGVHGRVEGASPTLWAALLACWARATFRYRAGLGHAVTGLAAVLFVDPFREQAELIGDDLIQWQAAPGADA